jgi:hypothetical protein
MPEFILDTSGAVTPASYSLDSAVTWRELEGLEQGYIMALFFTETAPGVTTEEWQAEEEHDGGSLPGDVGFSDLSRNALRHIRRDCAAFKAQAGALLEAAYERGYSEERAGHDLWLTRNGHGVGFWDRDELAPDDDEYERLTNVMVEAGYQTAVWDMACAERNALKAKSLGSQLTELAKALGETWATFGDDGKVHLD